MASVEIRKVTDKKDLEAFISIEVVFDDDKPTSVQYLLDEEEAMKVLAENGNKDAIFEVAKTYARIPNDIESDRRKRLLGWAIVEEDGPRKGSGQSAPLQRERREPL